MQIDLSFPLFFGLILLGFASMSDGFIFWAAGLLGIIYPPVAIIFISIAILLGGIGALAPSRRKDISLLGVRALVTATLANLMSAALAGFFLTLA